MAQVRISPCGSNRPDWKSPRFFSVTPFNGDFVEIKVRKTCWIPCRYSGQVVHRLKVVRRHVEEIIVKGICDKDLTGLRAPDRMDAVSDR